MSADRDPYEVLGLGPGATWDEVRAARRRLVKSLHPDLHPGGGGVEAGRRLAAVNRAVDQLRAARDDPTPADDVVAEGPTVETRPVEALSFVIEASPAVAFEAVLLASVELGDVIHVDEPTLLGVLLDDPGPCQCLVELVPQAGGGSIVTLDVGPRAYGECPTVPEVRDALLAEVQRFFEGDSCS